MYEFRAPIGQGSIPFLDVNDFGLIARHVFENSRETVGKTLSWGAWYTTYSELASAFENTTGKKAVFKDVTQEEWFEGISSYVNPDIKLPRGVDPSEKTAFTFRKTFGAWWNVWKYIIRDPEQELLNHAWSDMATPTRARNIEQWMRRTNYTGT